MNLEVGSTAAVLSSVCLNFRMYEIRCSIWCTVLLFEAFVPMFFFYINLRTKELSFPHAALADWVS